MKTALSILFLLVGLNASAHACSCVIRTHERDFREARALFIGRVLDVGPNNGGDDEIRRLLPFKITFAVEKSWKGARGQITIVSNNGEGGCGGFKFEKGERYLIYAFGPELEAETACARSRPLTRTDEGREKERSELGSFWFRFKARVWRV